jgi:hypothetical protein
MARVCVPMGVGVLPVTIFCAVVVHCGAALGLTQDEVFKSINDNVGSPADPTKMVPWVCGAVVVAMLIFFYSKWQNRQVTPKLLNNSNKLMREVLKKLPIRRTPVKHLKMLAEQQGCSSPLTLLICPSLLSSAAKRVKIPKGGKGASTVEQDRDALLRLAKELMVQEHDRTA